MITINKIKSALFGASISILLTACGGSSSTNKTPDDITVPKPVAFDYQNLIDNKISSDDFFWHHIISHYS